jgi:ribosomal small subunit protein bTHX
MGRGDKKTKKGKISKGSFGVSRKRNSIKAKLRKTASKKVVGSGAGSPEADAPAKPKRTAAKKKSEA